MSKTPLRITVLSTTLCVMGIILTRTVAPVPHPIAPTYARLSPSLATSSRLAGASPSMVVPVINPQSFLLCLQQSDIIVAGTVRSVAGDQKVVQQIHGHHFQGHERQATLELQTIYRGVGIADKSITFHYFEPEEYMGYDQLQAGAVRLYFLKTDREKRITPSNPYCISFPVLEQRPELQDLTSPTEAVEVELLHNLQQGSERIIVESLKVLWKSQRVIEVCKTQLAHHESFAVRAAALAYRIRYQDKDALDDAIATIKEVKNTHVLQANGTLQKQIIQTISLAIPDMAAVIQPPQAKQLLHLRVPGMEREPGAEYTGIEGAIGEILRRFAVGEVKRQDTAKFAPVAIELLKSGENIDARYAAFQMLSNLRNLDGPSIFEFAGNIQRYVKEYSDWWVKEGNRKYGNHG